MANAPEYAQLLMMLLPTGDIWPREADSTLGQLMAAKAEELARMDAALMRLVEESDPRSAFELLTDWERVCGLPDKCSELTDTLADRRAAVVTQLTALPAETPASYRAMAQTLGYEVSITEFRPFSAGSEAGTPAYGESWAHAWQVNAPETTVQSFRADNATAGEPLRSWGNDKLECVIQQHAPAHTVTLFAYGS
jgi:uncharacterized protein YmfQ (DUF2313 family)